MSWIEILEVSIALDTWFYTLLLWTLKVGEVESGIRTACSPTQMCTQSLPANAGELKRRGWMWVLSLG